MDTICASIYLYFLLFLSSVSYNFLCTGLLHPWLGLFLGILFFLNGIVNGIVFFLLVHCWHILNATGFWVLILYPATLLNSSFGF